MRRWRDPTPGDRLASYAMAALVTAALLYAVYFVATIGDQIQPVRPSSRPLAVPEHATWLGERGAKEGVWLACSSDGSPAMYVCHLWREGGRLEQTALYRHTGGGTPLAQPEVERWEGRMVYLRGGGELRYVGTLEESALVDG